MGNCVRCSRNKGTAQDEEIDRPKTKGKKGLKQRKGKDKSKVKAAKGEKKSRANGSERNEKVKDRINQQENEAEEMVKLTSTPLEQNGIRESESHALGPQERKVLRLVLPYIPKKQWAKLREVCTTWCAVVDGEWARMHTLHLTEIVPTETDGHGIEKRRLAADHISTKCQLSRSIVCSPPKNQDAVDLSDEEFWRRLQPRTHDLTTLKLEQVYLPRYFFTDFLPRCQNLEDMEVVEAPEYGRGGDEGWTAEDRTSIESTINRLEKLGSVRVKLGDNRKGRLGEHPVIHASSTHEVSRISNGSVGISNGGWTNGPGIQRDDLWTKNGPTTEHSQVSPATQIVEPYRPDPHMEAVLMKTAGPGLKSFAYDRVPLSPKILKTLGTCTGLTALSFDLNLDLLDPQENDHQIRNTFSSFQNLSDLRINIFSNEHNVRQTLQTLALILKTVAKNSKKLTTLKLNRLPDPMGVDKSLATEITTAFIKLNDETQLNKLHVCILAPQERFHAWSLPWPAFNRLTTLTLTDTNLYPERPRGIDLEAMPRLTTFTLCSDSLDDDMITRVFTQPHVSLSELTLEPGPNGIGRGGLRTLAVVCQNLHHLTISYCRTEERVKRKVDTSGWTAFYRVAPDTLKSVTLIDLDRGYVNEEIMPVARQCPQIELKPVYGKTSFDTFADVRTVSNGTHY